jgi:hypothetical protein
MLSHPDIAYRLQNLRNEEFQRKAARARLIAGATNGAPRVPSPGGVRAAIRRVLPSFPVTGLSLFARRRVPVG